MQLHVSPAGTGSRGQGPFIMRWSVIFSTSYAGSCLRGGREKEVFFEGGKKRQSEAQSGLQRGRWRGGGGLNRNTRCHCVRIQMWAPPVMSFTSPTPPRVIRRAAFLGNRKRKQRATVFGSSAILTHFVVTYKWFFSSSLVCPNDD